MQKSLKMKLLVNATKSFYALFFLFTLRTSPKLAEETVFMSFLAFQSQQTSPQ